MRFTLVSNQFGGFGQQYQSTTNPSMNPTLNPAMSLMSPPPWATGLIEDIKTIKQQNNIVVSKIDKIEESVSKITLKVEQLELQVKSMENSCNFINGQFEETKLKLNKSEEQIKIFNEKTNKFENILHTYQTKLTQIEDSNDKLEFHSLRENLLFHGIKETSNQENCEETIKTLIRDVLRIEKNIELDRVHRIGKASPGKTRPIVAKFHHYSDRELVRKASIDNNQDLRTLHQGVGIQQTKATLEKRRSKQHIVDRERTAGRITKWAGSRLLVKGQNGTYQEINN